LFEDTVKDELVAGGVDPDDIHDIELSEGFKDDYVFRKCYC
jgi:hypothetical protein